jgi:hypothetical protein
MLRVYYTVFAITTSGMFSECRGTRLPRMWLTCSRINVDDGSHGIGTQDLVGEINQDFGTGDNGDNGEPILGFEFRLGESCTLNEESIIFAFVPQIRYLRERM